jgi:hypothetical protein
MHLLMLAMLLLWRVLQRALWRMLGSTRILMPPPTLRRAVAVAAVEAAAMAAEEAPPPTAAAAAAVAGKAVQGAGSM